MEVSTLISLYVLLFFIEITKINFVISIRINIYLEGEMDFSLVLYAVAAKIFVGSNELLVISVWVYIWGNL